MYDMRVLGVGGREGEGQRRRREEESRCLKAFCPATMKGKKESSIFMQVLLAFLSFLSLLFLFPPPLFSLLLLPPLLLLVYTF
jgi:hypothetical protein